jgi:phage portal protein BeeE
VSETGAWKLYGPDGNSLLLGGSSDEPMEREYAQVVAKKVRSKQVSMTAAVDRIRGREKPTPVTYETLRLMARRNEWIRAIISTRARQIRKLQWDIVIREEAGEDPSGAAQKACKKVQKLLTYPQLHGSQPEAVHWHQWISMWLEDLLCLDRACVEKERDGRKWIKALYVVDGATIRPNLDSRGSYFHPDSYIQIVDGLPETRFGMEDLSCTLDNPQSDINWRGYGMSPLESLVVSVTADLHAAKYNSDYFTKGSVPEGVLHLGEEIDPELVDAFRLYWLNEIQGKPHAFPIIGGSKAPEFLQWREGNRDMQFMEYCNWLLQKMCAVFQISPKELGQIDDVNRSTAEDASQSDDQKGIEPLMQLIKQMVDLEVIGELGLGLGDYLEFQWEQPAELAEAINKKFQPMVENGAATSGEWRDAHGMDPAGDPNATHGTDGLAMHLKDGQPLPSRQDADMQGTAAEQDREDELGETEHARAGETADDAHEKAKELSEGEGDEGGTPTNVGWDRADPDHPDTKAAMAAHDDEHGIGPRNKKVGKVANFATLHDANPVMTKAETDLVDVFDRATERLVDGLSEILGARR